jgi:ferrous iron transport protein B
MSAAKVVKIALAGQPNVGKSTVFNLLTGLSQHVGNWPGKTVEQRSGVFVHDGVTVEMVDLPGTYCLTAASPEELVTREYIVREKPDVVLVVISAASLERNLYLVTELLALPAPLVIGLNMLDVARREGFEVRAQVLAETIGVPVIPMTATRNEGVRELIDAALVVARCGPARVPERPAIRQDHQEVLAALRAILAGRAPAPYPEDWVALKLLEGDEQVMGMMHGALASQEWLEVKTLLDQHEDAIIAVASGRYAWICRMTQTALVRPRAGQISLTQRLDSVATHPFWGLVMLAGVLALIFSLTYTLGAPLQRMMAVQGVGRLVGLAQRLLAGGPRWFSGLLIEGVIAGLGTMLTFLPILVLFFVAMALIEDTGYMARAAYVMDRFMHVLGLHGKSFVPLFLGFGCNVPAILGTRIIESPRGRLLTILLAPLVPCTGRLAVLTVLVPVFFPRHAALVSWALTGLPLLVLALIGFLANRFVLRGESGAFIMEMPLYHVPNARTIGLFVWQHVRAFLERAGTIILLISVFVWALATLPGGDIQTSYLAAFGHWLAPLGGLMGLDWRLLVALLTSFVAKENAVATLSVLYGVSKGTGPLLGTLSTAIAPASGLAFLVAQMLFVPCASTVTVIKQEAGSWTWALADALFLAILAVGGGIITYHLAVLF